MVESSVLFLVASVLSLGVNWTCVAFPCSGDYSLNRHYRNLQEFHVRFAQSEMEFIGCKRV